MVNIYDDYRNELVEQIAYDLFEELGTVPERIDPGHLVDVMLMLDGKVKVDIQKKDFFATNGDFAIDFVAACDARTAADPAVEADDLFGRFADKQNIKITKRGKHFQTDNFDYLIVFVYDEFIDANKYDRYEETKDQPKILPDYTLLIKSDELAQHILDNSAYYFDRIDIQRKTNNPIIHKVDSSVVHVPVEKLRAETDCLFYDGLAVNGEEVMKYLGL